jgi:signal transduction histidine kinase
MRRVMTPDEKLQELRAFSRMLVSFMNHELRGSINIVSGYTGIVLEEWSGPVSAEQKQALQVAADAGKALLRQLGDLVDVSRLEFLDPDPLLAEFDLGELAMEVAAEHASAASAKGIELAVKGVHFPVLTDRTRLRRCMHELLENAVKYTEKGSVVMMYGHAGGEAEVKVADSGAGLTEEEMKKLFTTYARFPYAVRNRIPGTGLGLYLVARTMETLGGEVSLVSIPGEGTTATLRFPATGGMT